MPLTTRIRPAWALTVALIFGAAARGQDESEVEATEPTPSETAEEPGFPWLCFTLSVAGLAGLGALVIRAKRRVEGDHPRVRAVGEVWYCRACDRDVEGPACPRCGAPNPFLNTGEL